MIDRDRKNWLTDQTIDRTQTRPDACGRFFKDRNGRPRSPFKMPFAEMGGRRYPRTQRRGKGFFLRRRSIAVGNSPRPGSACSFATPSGTPPVSTFRAAIASPAARKKTPNLVPSRLSAAPRKSRQSRSALSASQIKAIGVQLYQTDRVKS